MIDINNTGNFLLNREVLIQKNDVIEFVLYEYSGELLMRSIGNLFIRIDNLEIRLCNGISEEELRKIVDSLTRFLDRKEIKVIRKKHPF